MLGFFFFSFFHTPLSLILSFLSLPFPFFLFFVSLILSPSFVLLVKQLKRCATARIGFPLLRLFGRFFGLVSWTKFCFKIYIYISFPRFARKTHLLYATKHIQYIFYIYISLCCLSFAVSLLSFLPPSLHPPIRPRFLPFFISFLEGANRARPRRCSTRENRGTIEERPSFSSPRYSLLRRFPRGGSG